MLVLSLSLFLLGFVRVVNDFFSVIVTTDWANVMTFDHRSAVWAADKAGHIEFEMGSP